MKNSLLNSTNISDTINCAFLLRCNFLQLLLLGSTLGLHFTVTLNGNL